MGELNEPYDGYNEDRQFTQFVINVRSDEMGIRQYICDGSNTTLYLHDPDRYDQYDHFFRRLVGEELPEEHRNREQIMGGFITRLIMGEDDFEATAESVVNSFNFSVVYRPVPIPSDVEAIDTQMQATLHRELDGLSWEDFQ